MWIVFVSGTLAGMWNVEYVVVSGSLAGMWFGARLPEKETKTQSTFHIPARLPETTFQQV